MPARPTKTERVAEGIHKLTWASGKTTYLATVPEWTDAGGKRQQPKKTLPTLTDARAWRREQLGLRARGLKKPTGRLTLGDFMDDWIDRYTRRRPGNTAARYRYGLSKMSGLPVWGARLADLEPDDIVAAYDQLEPTDVTYVHDALHRGLSEAVPRLIARNPATGAMRGRRVERAERHVWTEEEYRAFLDAADRHDVCPALWWTLGQTGVRRGELLGFDRPDIDLSTALILVRRQFAVVDGRHTLKDVKTDHGRRSIPIDSDTNDRIRDWMKKPARRLGRDAHALFTHADGRRLAPTKHLQKRFDGIVTAAGVRSIRIHDVRHTHATLLLMRGVPVNVVSERLGHANEAITLMTYGHVMPRGAQIAADVASLIARDRTTDESEQTGV